MNAFAMLPIDVRERMVREAMATPYRTDKANATYQEGVCSAIAAMLPQPATGTLVTCTLQKAAEYAGPMPTGNDGAARIAWRNVKRSKAVELLSAL